ncbi:MAG: transcription-repair coupling factor [Alphaproteobacteria bacterium]|nr:transcription-repair coupling factor [Alphaproteobacteria bacterium]
MSQPALSPTKSKMTNVKTLYGAPEGHDVRLLADKARACANIDQVLVHVAVDDTRLATLKDLFAFFAPDVSVIEFPAWDCLPYDRVSPSNEIVATRVAALTGLLQWEVEKKRYPRVLLTTVNAIVQRMSPRAHFEASGFSVSVGGTINQDNLLSYMISNGYVRTETVREAGEFAIRGGIIDLFPSGHEKPVRIDLFGDEVDTIRTFDPITQRTDKKLESFGLRPVTEFFLDEKSIQSFRSGYREQFGAVRDGDPLYEAVSEGRRYNGMDHWLPLFYGGSLDTIFDYIDAPVVSMDAQVEQARLERANQIEDFYQARKTLETAAEVRKPTKKNFKRGEGTDVSMTGTVYHPLPVDQLYVGDGEWQSVVAQVEAPQQLSPFKMPEAAVETDEDFEGRKGRDFADIRALPDGDLMGALKTHIESINIASRKVMIAAYSEGARDRLLIMLENAGLKYLKTCDNFDAVKKLQNHEVALTILPLENGFISEDFAVLTEQDILGDRLARKTSKRKKADNFLTEVSSLDENDLVVHVDHGVGRFVGLETLSVGGAQHDCLRIVYGGDDKLFVPVENIEVLSRYGSDEGTAQLDKLGGAGWQARKAKVKKDLMKIAEHLMKIAAARQLRKGEKLSVDTTMYQEFAARFPYHETEDQLRSINSVIEDLAGDHPMDRLVCGDVGFGKTEVAMRAAYVAAMSGVQVAVVVPTTLLARQHYAGFVKRFEGLGLRIGQLSRMVSAKDAKATKDELAEGTVNIVVGTHALFSQDVKFAHLGLVIVDEEQRFGVKQKEKLKELKSDVHVLTLTATPIPRTLQMSLTGVKEMSLITTPPVDRLAIRTFVLPYDQMVIREALMREHYRGGQSFYVCPRIKDLKEVEDQLKELVPELKTISAHGQMTPTELEDRMSAFYDGQYDILLATQIVESGLDIPTANTMVVHRADMFGLAQLYQIRGRIGRSKVRAYAYLTHDPLKKLTPQGQKRLEVIETLDTLGAGFQLASHDMDIRGAGNLVGEEQSGHIKEVGVELYQQMLEEAVAMAKAGIDLDSDEAASEVWSPQINIGTSVLIPEVYVEDLSVRMSLYRRLSELETTQDVEAFAAELIDRFGPIPDEVENLLDIVKIKQLCKQAGIDRVDAGPKGAVLGFHKDVPPNVEKLMGWLTSKRGAVKLRPDQKIALVRHWETAPERVKGVQTVIKELASL